MGINKTIEKLIFDSVDEINIQLPDNKELTKSKNTALFGNTGQLDSLGLVNLLVTIEQNIEDKFDINITIADEKAMSQKHSPFRTIGSLVDYIEMILKEI